MAVKDSYDLFLRHFGISKDDFYEFGLKNTIFIDHDIARERWDELKARIRGGKKVFIRGYGQNSSGTKDLISFYHSLFGNIEIEADKSRNSEPKKLVETLTKEKRNKTIFNYQVSHIWGQTKNPYMFGAPWNICFAPKMFDPFTGHETKGCWPKEYQKMFIKQAFEKYKDLIEEYNQIMDGLDFGNKLSDFLAKQVDWDDKKKERFEKTIKTEFAKIKI